MRAGESVLGAEKTVALGTGLARERRLLITGEPPKQAEDRKKPNSSACTGLAEHLLPRRHGLIQSFPSSSNGLLVHTHASSSDGLLVHTHERNRSPGVKVEGLGLLVSRDRTAATPARAISAQTFS